mgnify:CR=1 FL=1|jgi:hypothetical protein
MVTYKIGDSVMFSTPKGTVKVGVIKDVKSVLHFDEYEDVYTVEIETGKIYYIDHNRIINKVQQ